MSIEAKDLIEKIDSLKATLDGYRPFPDYVVKQLKDYYRIGLTYTSNAIEGNTLTESETKVVIIFFAFAFLNSVKSEQRL